LSGLHLPVESITCLPDCKPEQGVPQSIITVSRASIKSVPTLHTRAPIDGNFEAAQFGLLRRRRVSPSRLGLLRWWGRLLRRYLPSTQEKDHYGHPRYGSPLH
jgi:hypothetical protein